MKRAEKPIVFTLHSLKRMAEREISEKEAAEAIRKGEWVPAMKGRYSCAGTFRFEKEHYGRYYKLKEVVPVFIEESHRILVITVYSFFSQGGEGQ